MEAIQSLVLGVVQGLTEFLPISSSAHLAIVPWFFGWQGHGQTFDVALHVGTLVAVTAYFRDDLWRMAQAFFASLPVLVRRFSGPAEAAPVPLEPHARLAWMVILGCLPAIVVGVLIEKWVETTLRSPLVIAGTLIGVALIIWAVDRTARGHRGWPDLSLRDALAIGCAQACALVPGVSRSGSTIAMGLFLGLSRSDAARFSFLLGYPVILGSAVFKLRHIFEDAALQSLIPAMLVGGAAAAVSGYLCIAFLLRFLATQTMFVFVVYRLALGALILLLVAQGKPITLVD